ncbi:MAG TPA: GAF domain-containing protein [Thermoanaerobaculia bacterium]|nr:GAF domain-containing protein [Thermoanaerobaculia bacterium]
MTITGKASSLSRDVVELVTVALSQERRSGLAEILRAVAEAVGAMGCILWQETPAANQLFVLADWWLGSVRSYRHNLSLENSATGQAILHQTVVVVNDVNTDSRVDRHDGFVERAGIFCFCSIPLKIAGKRGALALYRTVPQPFEEQDLSRLSELASLLPSLYQTIVDRMSYQLVGAISKILQRADRSAPSNRARLRTFRTTAQALCDCLAGAFDALEVSLFIEDSLLEPGVFRLAATTWPERKKFAKLTYAANADEGLTGWILENHKPLRIFDLAHFERERHLLRSHYPRLIWKDSLRIESSVRRILGVPPDKGLQPLSFMGAPVLSGGKVVGVIRCCTATQSPFFYGEQEVQLLELVADQIGQIWSRWLQQREIEEEIRTWERLADSMRELNHFVEQQAGIKAPNETLVFHKALEITNQVIPGAEISDVRLLNEQANELYFEATCGHAWQEGTPAEIASRRGRRFPVTGYPPNSAGAYVVQTGQLYLNPDTSSPKYHYSKTFQSTRRIIVAPISVAGKLFGVLDIRGTGNREFPRYATKIAEILSQQLGLYHYLLKTFAELESFRRNQAQTFEDFTHQLRSPILQVHARSQACLRLALPETSASENLRTQLRAVRGLTAKAKTVSQSLSLFADLAAGKPLRPTLMRLSADFVKTVIEAADDHQCTLDPDRQLHFQVDREGFETLKTVDVAADTSLLLQVVNNLLDNAAKYSFSKTVVKVYAGITASGRFHITVMNNGLALRKEEIRRCLERGWRGQGAKEVTGEGSGIGLWIVDYIMKAHQGEILIIPTTAERWTEAKLLFPAVYVK